MRNPGNLYQNTEAVKIADEYALEESHFLFTSTGEYDRIKKGIAPYKDESESLGLARSGWGWETKFADLNNDGELEALQATGFRKGEVYQNIEGFLDGLPRLPF